MSTTALEDRAVAAAILVSVVFSADERLRTMLKKHTVSREKQQDAEATAAFLKPWHDAMSTMLANIGTRSAQASTNKDQSDPKAREFLDKLSKQVEGE